MKKLLFIILLLPCFVNAQIIQGINMTMPNLTPTVSASPTTETGMADVYGSNGTNVTITVTFANPNPVITETISGPFEASVDGGTTWGSGKTFSTGSPYAVLVRIINGTAVGSVSGSITFANPGATSAVVTLSGSVTAVPTLTLSSSTLNPTSTAGIQGSAVSTTITASNFGSNNVTVPATPTGYVDSIAGGSWASASRTLTPSGGSLSQLIYYALGSSNTAGTNNTSTNITGDGLTATLTLDGTISAAPTIYAWTFSLSSATPPTGFTNVTGNPHASVLTGVSNGATLSTNSTAAWFPYSTNGSSDNGFGMTGSTISYFPDNALYNSFFSYSGASHSADSVDQTLANANFVISGLPASTTFIMRIASSASSSYGFTCNNQFRAEGLTSNGVIISPSIGDVRNNTTQYYQLTVTTTASGTITCWCFTTVGQQIFWVNAIYISTT